MTDKYVWLHEYKKLNNSFKKRLVFRLGYNAGFFSEYNNMLYTILYCLQHEIKFELNTSFANFKIEEGWEDFFEPFCYENKSWYNKEYNSRNILRKSAGRKLFYTYNFVKRFYGIKYFTQDLLQKVWEKPKEGNEKFCFPTLGINGDLTSALNTISQLIWNYNDETKKEINAIISALDLPPDFITMHIRMGDKITEAALIPYRLFMEKAETISDCRNAFIYTDDYLVVQEIKKEYPKWNIYSFVDEQDQGYVNSEFEKLPSPIKKEKLVKMFAATQLMKESKFFIGSYISNLDLFIIFMKNNNNNLYFKCDELALKNAHWQEKNIYDKLNDLGCLC